MLARRAGPWLALAAILVAAGTLVSAELHRVDYLEGADEGYYLRYATALADEGFGAFPRLFAEYVENETNHLFPSPLRVLHLTAARGLVAAFGASFSTLSGLSLLAHLALIALAFLFGRRRLGTLPGLAFAALVAASPLALGLARRALADSFATLFAALALGLVLELVDEPASRPRVLAAGLAFAAAVLAKESAALLAPALLAIALVGPRRGSAIRATSLALIGGAALAFVVQSVAAGGPSRILEVARVILASPATNEYALQYGAGPWFRYLVDYLLLSPWVLLLAVGGLGAELAAPGDQRRLVLRAAVFAATFLLVVALLTKNVRYAAILDLPLRLGAVVALARLGAGQRKAIFAFGLAAVCALDVLSYRTLFVESHAPDPVTRELVLARRMIPHRELDQRRAAEAIERGNRAMRENDLPGAIAAYERAVEIAPRLVRARVNLGTLYFRARRLDAAEAQYRAALAIDPLLDDVKKSLETVEAVRAAQRARDIPGPPPGATDESGP